MKAKIMGVAFAALLALGLAACSNMDSGSVNGMMLAMTAQPSTVRSVSIMVGGDVRGVNNGISATVLPGKDMTTDAFKFKLSQLTCVLTGKSHLGGSIADGTGVIIHPATSGVNEGKVSLDLNAALWDLTLTAYPNNGWKAVDCGDPADPGDQDGTEWADPAAAKAGTKPALIATTSVDLRNGGQTVTFNLSATGLTGPGGKVTLAGHYVDKNVVTHWTAGLYSISDNRPVDVRGADITEVKNASPLTPTTGNVTFTADFTGVAAGSYRAAVALYNADETQVGYWSDIVVLNPCVPSIKSDIVIDNLLEPPAPPTNLAAYLVPGSYDKKNDGYYQVRLVWEDNSTNENYFRIKLDRYGVTPDLKYVAFSGTTVAGQLYYENNTGTLIDPQPDVGTTLTSKFVAEQTAPTKAASDAGYPLYLSPVASETTDAADNTVTDTVYRTSEFYSPEFVDLESANKCGLLAGSKSVVLKLQTGYIYEVKIVAHNAIGDSKDGVPGTDTAGVSKGAIWTDRKASGTESKAIMTTLGCTVDDSTPPAKDPTKYMPYGANVTGGLKGINLMSIKHLLGNGGRKYTTATKSETGPLYKYYRYGMDTAKTLIQASPANSGTPQASGYDFYSAVDKGATSTVLEKISDLNRANLPVIVKQSGNAASSSISDFSHWVDPVSSEIYEVANALEKNVTVLAFYGSSVSGQVNIEDIQEIAPARILAKYSTVKDDAPTGTDINPTTATPAGVKTIDASTKQYIYFAVDPDTSTVPADAREYTKFKFHINGNEQYAASNELYIDTSEMDSGTYHVLVEAYYQPQDKWFSYQFQFKISR